MTEANEVEDQAPTQLELLKKRAAMMGIKHHPSIGAVKLAEKIDAALANQSPNVGDHTPAPPQAVSGDPVIAETKAQRNARLRREAGRLIRVRVACMNPNKKDWEGEIFTVSNSVVGTYKKYVPFNAEKGWHVPMIMYKHMVEKQCQVFYTVKGPRGDKIRKGKQIRELAVEVLDPLTPEEIKDLAKQQAMANNLD